MNLGYARVSTLDQHLELQEDALAKAGCEKIFRDVASGAIDSRKGLAEAIEFARSGDTLVVWKLDRLGRSLKHLIETVNLLKECILYYNISILSKAIKRQEETNATEEILYLKQISPTAWQHINFLGRYEFGKLDNLINIDEIVDKLKPHQTQFGKINPS